MVSATPCACDSGSSLLTQSYENYDIPKNISQVSFQYLFIFQHSKNCNSMSNIIPSKWNTSIKMGEIHREPEN